MNSPFFKNLVKAKYHLAFIFGSIFIISENDKVQLKNYVFGLDGNGGDMLKIHTYLTDQEIASLRFQQRFSWHTTKLEKDAFKNTGRRINDEELRDLGIKFPEDRYVEYNKRPPHDFYL
jgi:hypothetical protein